jgi:hypothetical protein
MIIACFCGIVCALGFSWLIQFYRKRYGDAEGSATFIFGGWVAVSVFVIFLGHASLFGVHSSWLRGGLLAVVAIAALVWMTRVLGKPAKR